MESTKKTKAQIGILLLVIIYYFFFTMPYLHPERFTKLPHGYYQQLTEAFILGQTSLTEQPSPELAKLSNPYNPILSYKYRDFDLSYIHHKYYVYWGPLPVLTYFLPFKILTGWYASTGLGLFLFISVGFLFNWLLLIKIKNDHFPSIPDWQLILLLAMMGFANNSTFLQILPRQNEVAIASAYWMMSIALYYLYNIFKKNFQTRTYYIFSACIGLAVAGRPNFAIVCILLTVITSVYLIKNAPRKKLLNLLVALLLPSTCVAAGLAVYNYVRFGSIFEFGRAYLLGTLDYTHLNQISPTFYRTIPLQLYYYLVQPFLLTADKYHSELPDFMQSWSQPAIYEPVFGILTTTPIVLFILFLPKFWRVYSKNEQPAAQQLLWFLSTTVALIAVNASILLVVYYTAQRYVSDFLPYLIICAIINLWFVQTNKIYSGAALVLLKSFVLFSIVMSIVLGAEFGYGAFQVFFTQYHLLMLTHFTLCGVASFALAWAILGITKIISQNVLPRPA